MKTQFISALEIHRFENGIDDLIDFRMVRGVLDVCGMDCRHDFQPFGELLQEGTIVVANQMNLVKGFFVQ